MTAPFSPSETLRAKLCNHPELRPSQWEQTKPAPTYMNGCIHNHTCPVCGFGQGIGNHSSFNCKHKLAAPVLEGKK